MDWKIREEHRKNFVGLLKDLGEDPDRDGLIKTPDRYLKSMEFLTSGYEADPAEIINGALFEVDHNEMVIVRDIEFYSLCEHHMLPFHGRVHVGYIPENRIVGLSKIPRLVDAVARRLQVQERITTEIASLLEEHVQPMGVGVVVEAYHLCMMMRGVEKQSSYTVSSSVRGCFRAGETREEFLRLVHAPRRTFM